MSDLLFHLPHAVLVAVTAALAWPIVTNRWHGGAR